MTAGAPRTVSPPPEEMIELGKEMINWVKQNNPVHLSQWYSIHKMFTEKQWDAMQKLPEFVPYYEMALKLVGLQYIMKGSDVEPAIKQRWQRVYFKDLKREEDETAVFNAQISKQSETQGTEEQNKKLDQLLSVMRNTQEALKSEDTINSSE